MNKKLFLIYIWFLNIITVGLFFYLPYYIFEGRLFLGGDDTRFYYAYPTDVLRNFAFFSWNNISSLPLYIPNHHLVPFLIVSSLLENVFSSKVYLFYFLFSLLLILGFVYFQKFIRLLIGKEYVISFAAALLYVLAPITLVSHLSHFLTPVWLIALVPIIGYYYVNYIKYGRPLDILKAVLWSIFLSLAYFAIPWILGIMLPILLGLIVFRIFIGNPFEGILKKTLVFYLFILVSQLFWLLPFFMSLMYRGESDLGAQVVSKTLADTFSPTVLATATGNIINPLLTMYHRGIAFEYNWQLKDAFIKYYDPLLILSTIYIFVLFMGILKFKKVLKGDQEKLFIFFFVVFLAGLYFFTVNIGFLKNIFLVMGSIPGFSILRNFIDKCSLGYIFSYSIFLSFCLFIIKKSFKFYNPLIIIFTFVVFINFIPAKNIINAPLWTTTNVYQTVNLPKEYLDFSKNAKAVIPSSSNILNIPQNSAAYTVITEKNGKNAYVGTSPFKFLTGINDLGGSYPSKKATEIKDSIITKDYNKTLVILDDLNVGYMFVARNIPSQIYNSYIVDKEYIKSQNKEFIQSVSEKVILKSTQGNYELHKLKINPKVITSNAKVNYEKVNSGKYKITLKNINDSSTLVFHETFHPGWRLYMGPESYKNTVSNNFFDIAYLIKNSYFDSSHKNYNRYGNVWTVELGTIKNDPELYTKNKDGSVNVVITLYFLPQVHFYIGIILTVAFLVAGFLLVHYKNEKK